MPFSVERRSTRVAGKTCQRLSTRAWVGRRRPLRLIPMLFSVSRGQPLCCSPKGRSFGLSDVHGDSPFIGGVRLHSPRGLACCRQTQHRTPACWRAGALRPCKRGVPSEPAAPLAKRHLACRSSGEVVGGSSVRTWVSRIAFAVVAAVRGYGYPYHTKPLLRDPQAQLRQATRHTCYCDLITHRESHRRYCYNV